MKFRITRPNGDAITAEADAAVIPESGVLTLIAADGFPLLALNRGEWSMVTRVVEGNGAVPHDLPGV